MHFDTLQAICMLIPGNDLSVYNEEHLFYLTAGLIIFRYKQFCAFRILKTIWS